MEIVWIKRTREFPVLPARGGIERHHFGQARRIQNAVHDNRRVLHLLVGRRGGGPPYPLELQIFDIIPIDLRQPAIAITFITSRVGEPILRFLLGVKQAIERDLRLQGTHEETQHHQHAFHILSSKMGMSHSLPVCVALRKRHKYDIPELDPAVVALQLDRPGPTFERIKRDPRQAVDDSLLVKLLSIQDRSDFTTDEAYLVGLPLARWLARIHTR